MQPEGHPWRRTMRNKYVLSTALISSLVASACCVGPVLLAIIGVGAAGSLTFLSGFRLYFIGLTVLLLGIAFYLNYRKREVRCEDGTCKVVTGERWSKISVWIAALAAAAIIAFPYLDGSSSATAASTKDPAAQVTHSPATTSSTAGDSCCEIRKSPSAEKSRLHSNTKSHR